MRAIIFFKNNQFCRVKKISKNFEVLCTGSLEFINGLIIITDGKNIWKIGCFRYFFHEIELRTIGILVFIDHNPLVLFCYICSHIVIFLKNFFRRKNHIRKIYKSFFLEGRIVLFINVQKRERFFIFFKILEDKIIIFIFFEPFISPCCDIFCIATFYYFSHRSQDSFRKTFLCAVVLWKVSQNNLEFRRKFSKNLYFLFFFYFFLPQRLYMRKSLCNNRSDMVQYLFI